MTTSRHPGPSDDQVARAGAYLKRAIEELGPVAAEVEQDERGWITRVSLRSTDGTRVSFWPDEEGAACLSWSVEYPHRFPWLGEKRERKSGKA